MQTVCNTYWDAGKGNLTAQNTRKPFGGRDPAPDPTVGAYNSPANPLVGGEGLAIPSPRTPSPAVGPRLFYPHSKINSDAVGQSRRYINRSLDLSSISVKLLNVRNVFSDRRTTSGYRCGGILSACWHFYGDGILFRGHFVRGHYVVMSRGFMSWIPR